MIINPTPIIVNNLMINSILSQQNTLRVREQGKEVGEKSPTLHEFVNKELKREDVISLQEFIDKEMGK
jgi:hypothetical protein